MLAKSLIASALLFATSAHAHATFQQLWINGADQGTKCTRVVTTNSPISSVTDANMACNAGGNVPAASTCEVAAGDSLDVEMHQQPNQRECTTDAIGGNHDGPTIVYMAKVEDIAMTDPTSANWFKVAETGMVSKDFWGTDVMNKNCGKVPFTVPSDIAPGNYLIRAEVIALHAAGSLGGAQPYASCYQIKVTGSGSATPANTVKFPGAYDPTDPGIKFDLYNNPTSYTIPGPALYVSGGGSAPAPAPATSAAPTSSVPATAAPEPTPEPSTSAVDPVPTTSVVAPEPTTETSVAAPEPTVETSVAAPEPTIETSIAAPVPTTSVAAPEPTTIVEEPTTSVAAPEPTSSVAAPVPTTVAAPAPAPTGGAKDANACWRDYNHCLDASQPRPDFTGCSTTRETCLTGARYQRLRRSRFTKARL